MEKAIVKEHELFINPENEAGFSKALESLPNKITLNIMVAELEGGGERKWSIHPQKSHHRLDRESAK